MNRRAHWKQIYEKYLPDEVSWYQAHPADSLELIEATGVGTQAEVIDVGGGASTLVDELLARGYERVAVLDVAEPALAAAKQRLGDSAAAVEWYPADITGFDPPHRWKLWHDRAVFHFLVEEVDRRAYLGVLERAVEPGGHAIIATFGPDGPEKCSGLPVQRYGPEELAGILGDQWELITHRSVMHETPWGSQQAFSYCHFCRSAAA